MKEVEYTKKEVDDTSAFGKALPSVKYGIFKNELCEVHKYDSFDNTYFIKYATGSLGSWIHENRIEFIDEM